ncbi:hypothetical protein DBR47_03485 [Paucibacter sp. KBW04]|uniref:FliM/FliN family flagellar motor switch protein n=1 Tax=Paucibacter sp. KBW04 TaxID=2153361 RepID=UPI000F57C156|nr:FliM/FliN family flagellar motor switch protein [Paucibacter sp. KBW04]RQO63600.1 hypothetical protein DBR47_03485 [Paucibacter sp. KBW04]
MNNIENSHFMTVDAVELSPLSSTESSVALQPSIGIAALSGVKANVRVFAGNISTSVGEILNMKDGAVFSMDKALNAPFDLMIGEAVVARGELVAVGENFGIRVTQIQSGSGL